VLGSRSSKATRRYVASADNGVWSLYGAQRAQPVATSGKWDGAERGSLRRKPLPGVATGCGESSMVRRGSTVRVRQRALQRPCKSGFYSPLILHSLQRAPGMEPIMELPGSRHRPSSPHASRPGPAADLRGLSDNADSAIGVRDDQRPRWRPLVVERPTCLRRDLSLLRLDLRHESSKTGRCRMEFGLACG
jgi:hypothetical protein